MKYKIVVLLLLCVAQTVGSSFRWDPNTVTYDNMKKLVAAGVVKPVNYEEYNRASFVSGLSSAYDFMSTAFGKLKDWFVARSYKGPIFKGQ